jgi:shikimate dehydrogenase
VSPAPSASTRLIALLGDPVSHSLSPHFQNAAFAAAGVDGVYVALRCAAADVPTLVRGISRAGGGGNVTLPHKEAAAEAVERPSRAVQRTGACNTWWLEDGVVCGDNTDVVGVRDAVRALLGRDPAGARVLLLGAGGSSRAALAALVDAGAGEVVIANRTPDRARGLAARFADAATPLRVATPDRLAGERFDLAVNSTSLGLRESDPLPLPPDGTAVGAALDLVYARGSTPWVRALRERGVPAADGIEMLLRQGAASFERWWGIPAPLEAMRRALAPSPAPGP